ncbi:MAG: hypothetical protein WC674_00695 [Candidatus Krumholzibacteriia bacterium]
MKKLVALTSAMLLLGVCGTAFAASSTTQTVTYQVSAINEISVSGNPGALIVSAATAGSQPTAVTDATTTYAITTNGSLKRITGVLNTAMPANTSLKVTVTAPSTGTGAGQVTLTATAANLVTAIGAVAQSGIAISYEFSATAAAGVVASAQKTVTLTVADAV